MVTWSVPSGCFHQQNSRPNMLHTKFHWKIWKSYHTAIKAQCRFHKIQAMHRGCFLNVRFKSRKIGNIMVMRDIYRNIRHTLGTEHHKSGEIGTKRITLTSHVVPRYTLNIDLSEHQGIKSTINNWGDDASANSRIATASRRASSLLTNLPIKTKGFSLIKQEFTDAVGRPGSGRLSNQFSCGSSVDFSNEEEHSLYSLWYVTRKNCKINCKKLIMTLQ